MKIKEMPDARLLGEMRKQFSYSLFIFMLTVSLVVTLATRSLEKLTPEHVTIMLIVYAVLQASIYLTFLKQSRELKSRLKQRNEDFQPSGSGYRPPAAGSA